MFAIPQLSAIAEILLELNLKSRFKTVVLNAFKFISWSDGSCSIMVYYSEFFRVICSTDATSQIILIWRMFLNCLYEACCLTLVNTCNLSHLLNCRINLEATLTDSPATLWINIIIICTVPPPVGFTQSITWYIISCTWPSLTACSHFEVNWIFFLVIYSHTCFAPGHRIPAKSFLQWSTALVTCNI